jgi:acyl transferase domain-containing protein
VLHSVATPAVAETPASVPGPVAAAVAGKLVARRKGAGVRWATVPAAAAPQAIAVIGMAGQFPQAGNLEEFWDNLAQGRNCISEVPAERWDAKTYYQPGEIVAGKTNCKWAGTLAEYDRFDPLFFNISPGEAEHMDPQQRLFLQACWQTIEDAGYDARALSGSRCGVFAGCTNGDYQNLSRQSKLSAQGFTGNATSILAARISYFLNLQGPCISIDTACSSSLVALTSACDSLVSGTSDVALAGGVYVMAGPELHIKSAQAGMLSPEGKCFTFDQRANGFVPGEGVGVVMLKRLADAERDRDAIYGVIQGWGINQDGKTNGITAPNPESQTRLEQAVYDKYRIDPAGIQLVEGHGTGTKLGDPIEVEALKQAFKKYTGEKSYCALGSVKSNIGHCLTAAGIAGVIKVLLALRHQQLPPTINFEQLNEHIDLADSPFYVNDRLQAWRPAGGRKRCAAVSSFGFSGTNVHVVIGEADGAAESRPAVTAVTQNGRIVVPLSARRPAQLKEKARQLARFLQGPAPGCDLLELAYTLQVGREAMEHRVGFLAGSLEQLAERLQAYVDDAAEIPDVYQGQVRSNKESISLIVQDDETRETIVGNWIAHHKLDKLVDLWVRGLEVDWSRLYGTVKPRRISLPAYPFAKERYWLEGESDAAAPVSAVLHPLLHANTSDLSGQRYTSTFTGEEFFLADHRVRIEDGSLEKVLPAAVYLEMARAALQLACPERKDLLMELRDIVWLRPLFVRRPVPVSVTVFEDGDDELGFDIYTAGNAEEGPCCHGAAMFQERDEPVRRDLAQLRRATQDGRLDASEVYAIFSGMGMDYGPAHRGIVALELGKGQVVAELRLPEATGNGQYGLHPAILDSALQACLGLILEASGTPRNPVLPFAVKCIRVISVCQPEMFAWLRRAEESEPATGTTQVDIDLCDAEGNVCVEIRGIALRILEANGAAPEFDEAYYRALIANVAQHELSVAEAVEAS